MILALLLLIGQVESLEAAADRLEAQMDRLEALIQTVPEKPVPAKPDRGEDERGKTRQEPSTDGAPADSPWGTFQTVATVGVAGLGAGGAMATALWWNRKRKITSPDGTVTEEEETAMAFVETPCSNPAHGVIRSSHPLGADPKFKRGLKGRTPCHAIIGNLASGRWKLHKPSGAPPDTFGAIPKTLSMWLNDQDGDCVTAEEAFWIAWMTQFVQNSEIVVSDSAVLAFCNQFGVLNGADLQEVMQDMEQMGITDGSNNFKDGKFSVVDYTQDLNLRAAASQCGPIKIAIDANALPSGAGNASGWWVIGGSPGQFPNTDHCIPVAFIFGTAAQIFQAGGLPVPAGLDPTTKGYGAFTWKTWGFVDLPWINSTTVEAYGRDSLLMNGTPLTVGPTPSPTPTPTPTPVPSPNVLPAPLVVNVDGTWTWGGSAPTGGAILQADTVALIERDLGTPGTAPIPIPPFVLMLLKFLCGLLPKIPTPPPILVTLCKLIGAGTMQADGSMLITPAPEQRAEVEEYLARVAKLQAMVHTPCG